MADVTQRACPSENIPNNFMYYQAQRPSPPGLGLGLVPPAPSLTPFPNQDASFLLACASNRAHYVKGNDLVVLARGYLPRTPGGFDQPPLVADVSVSREEGQYHGVVATQWIQSTFVRPTPRTPTELPRAIRLLLCL